MIANAIATLLLLFGMLIAFLPGGFGVHNFNASHNPPITWIATSSWWILLLSHPFAIYKIYTTDAGSFWWLLLPISLHIIFFSLFGRDVST